MQIVGQNNDAEHYDIHVQMKSKRVSSVYSEDIMNVIPCCNVMILIDENRINQVMHVQI